MTDLSDLEKASSARRRARRSAPRIDADRREISLPIGGGAKALIAAGRLLDDKGIALDDLGIRRPSLDDVFLALTGHGATVAMAVTRRIGYRRRAMTDLAARRLAAGPPRSRRGWPFGTWWE